MMTILGTTTNSNLKIAIIITAAGSSTRIGSGIKKEYIPFNNGTVLSNCAKTFLKSCKNNFQITDFIITCPKNGIDECEKILESDLYLKELLYEVYEKNNNFFNIVEGGDSRQDSVLKALENIKNGPDIVLIHDGARPFVTEKIILNGIEVAEQYGAGVPGVTPIDTQKQIDKDGFIVTHLVRSLLTAVQTPQCFRFNDLLKAHRKAKADCDFAKQKNEKLEFTDDTEIWGKYCGPVKVYDGDVGNIKITYPDDLKVLENWKLK